MEGTYFPVWVLYKSAKARFVGVVLIQPASLEINNDFVDVLGHEIKT
jgi:hypothetical protein